MSTARNASLPPPSVEWAYFLDVDGTLVELAAHPDAVIVPQALRDMIAASHRHCGGALAVVSGRSVAALEAMLGIPGLAMAGQHGLERRDPDGSVRQLVLAPAALDEVAALLAPLHARHPGLLLERKGMSLAIHYRQAPRLGSHLHRLLGDFLASSPRGLQLQKGKYVLELKPAGHDKGSAIAAFMAQAPFEGRKPVFIGDDLTDEHGFAMVNAMQGISIKVGRGATRAAWRLPDVTAVRAWLATMTRTQGGGMA